MNKYKQVEELLKNYTMMQASIENMQDEIEYIKKEDGTTGINYDGVTTSPTHRFSSIVEDTVLSKSEKMHYLKHQIEGAKGLLERVDRAMEGLNEIEKAVIIGKYIEGLQWWQISGRVRYSERHCRRVRTEAIDKLVIGIYGQVGGEQ